jgi:hypothetical protein
MSSTLAAQQNFERLTVRTSQVGRTELYGRSQPLRIRSHAEKRYMTGLWRRTYLPDKREANRPEPAPQPGDERWCFASSSERTKMPATVFVADIFSTFSRGGGHVRIYACHRIIDSGQHDVDKYATSTGHRQSFRAANNLRKLPHHIPRKLNFVPLTSREMAYPGRFPFTGRTLE